MKRISFLVPTYNRAAFLDETLRAILGQMGDNDELLVIDDGSTDGTREIARHAGNRVEYIRQDNAGKSVALNRGLARTSGEFVLICDDDDRLRPAAVRQLLSALDDADAGFAFGRYTRFDDSSGEDIGVGYWPDMSRGTMLRHILEDAFVMQNAALVRRSALIAVGPFSAYMKRSQDYEMFVRLACSYPAKFIDDILFDQRKHAGQRGAAGFEHPASNSMQVWNSFDRAIFGNFFRTAPISIFESMFEGGLSEHRERAALLQRGVVMARHDCWELACDDFEQASARYTGPLDVGEYRICNRALGGKHGVGNLTDQAIVNRLRHVGRKTKQGREIVRAILSGGLWRLRASDSTKAWEVAKSLLHIEGLRAFSLAASHEGSKCRSAIIEERPDLPSDAYLTPGTISLVTGKGVL